MRGRPFIACRESLFREWRARLGLQLLQCFLVEIFRGWVLGRADLVIEPLQHGRAREMGKIRFGVVNAPLVVDGT